MQPVVLNSPFAVPNIRRFIALRICFNSRFYYPVFTILFLDFGLSLEQFALLNSVWAATIVLAEVPSGALADIIGRKRVLVCTSLIMFMELALIAVVPLGNNSLVFWVFLVNRVLSGLAEALASGTDEALAYDSLAERGLADEWPRVIDIQMRLQSAGFVVTMTIGALLYDPATVNLVLRWLDMSTSVTQQVTMRFPLYLTLVMSVLAFLTTISMTEPIVGRNEYDSPESFRGILHRAMKLTWTAGRWIITAPFALAVILFGMTFDHSLRMIVTMTSQYYRLIALPEATFGLIGSAIGMIGLVVPRIARSMSTHWPPVWNLGAVAIVSLSGLWGLTRFYPIVGLLPMILIFMGLMLTSFFTSHYLNRVTASQHRATVLSFKGLSFNLAYGMIGFLYAALVHHLRTEMNIRYPGLDVQFIENQSFRESIYWFPWYTLAIALTVLFFCSWSLRNTTIWKEREKR